MIDLNTTSSNLEITLISGGKIADETHATFYLGLSNFRQSWSISSNGIVVIEYVGCKENVTFIWSFNQLIYQGMKEYSKHSYKTLATTWRDKCYINVLKNFTCYVIIDKLYEVTNFNSNKIFLDCLPPWGTFTDFCVNIFPDANLDPR